MTDFIYRIGKQLLTVRDRSRMSAVAKDTVLKLLGMGGQACLDYQVAVLRNLPCKRLCSPKLHDTTGK